MVESQSSHLIKQTAVFTPKPMIHQVCLHRTKHLADRISNQHRSKVSLPNIICRPACGAKDSQEKTVHLHSSYGHKHTFVFWVDKKQDSYIANAHMDDIIEDASDILSMCSGEAQ